MKIVTFNNKEIELVDNYDVIVVGGGTSGSLASLSCARQGLKTLLVEKSIALGGSATNALVSPAMPTYIKPGITYQSVLDKLSDNGIEIYLNKMKTKWFNTEILSYVLQEVNLNSKVAILYNTTYIDNITINDEIKALVLHNIDGLKAYGSKYIIDATGDAAIARSLNIPTTNGDNNNHNQLMSLRFEMGGINFLELEQYLKTINAIKSNDNTIFNEMAMVLNKNNPLEVIFRKGVEEKLLLESDIHYFQAFIQPLKPGVMSFNCPHVTSINKSTSALNQSKAIIIAQEMIQRYTIFLKKMMPGFQNSYLSKIASQLGVRDSYQVQGIFNLDEEAYHNRATFSDGLVAGDWYIDVHNANNKYQEQEHLLPYEYYEIPYRCLIVEKYHNYMCVGRHISASFLMQASIRIQPTLMEMGVVAGYAIALAHNTNTKLNELDGKILREILVEKGEITWQK